MAETNPGTKIPPNKLLARLVTEGATNAITFRGYIGPTTNEGKVSLYPSLDDLSESVEFAQSDIIDYVELPEAALPLGGVIVWIKKDSTITNRRAGAARNLEGPKLEPNFLEVRQGRLRIRLGTRRLTDLPPCNGNCTTCQSRCNTCQSRCNTCQSRPE